MTTANGSVVVYAQQLARCGVQVFPCDEQKRPTCKWTKLSSKCPETVAMLWRAHPGPLIGAVTGSVSGFDALDLDWGKGGDDFYQEHCARLTGTRINRTRSGGLHLLFRHREGMRNSAGRIAPGVDVRADGGYIIWWPAAGLEIVERARIQQWPAWLVELATPSPPPKPKLERLQHGIENANRYVQSALRSAARQVATAGNGLRNQTLNAETFALGRFIAEGYLSANEIAVVMAAAGLEAGLSATEVEKTIASALRARMGG